MIVGILGANGRTGVCVVEEAQRRGHRVVAGVRGANTFSAREGLDVMSCDILNVKEVGDLVSRVDVVVSVVGHVKKSPPRLQTEGIKNIIQAMTDHKVRRLISLTGTGVRQENDRIPIYDRILNLGVSMIDPARIADGREHANIIERSEIDWTIIRVLKLQTKLKRPYALSDRGPTKLFVSRYDVASAILDVIEENSHIRAMPIISRP